MKHTVIALALLLDTNPAKATQMTDDQCARGWQAVQDAWEFSPGGDPFSFVIDADGWCLLDHADVNLLRWKADGIEEAIATGGFPQRFEAEVQGPELSEVLEVGASAEEVAIAISISQDASTRRATLERLKVDFGDLGELHILGALRGVNFSSEEAFFLSIGTARLEEVRLTLKNQGAFEKIALPKLKLDADTLRERIGPILDVLPGRLFEGDSRRELRRALRELPLSDGDLKLKLSSQTGLGAAQVGAGVARLTDVPWDDKDKIREGLDFMLDGVTLEVDWTRGG